MATLTNINKSSGSLGKILKHEVLKPSLRLLEVRQLRLLEDGGKRLLEDSETGTGRDGSIYISKNSATLTNINKS